MTKTEDDRRLLEHLLYVNFEIVRIASILLRPFTPRLSHDLLACLGQEFKIDQSLETQLKFDFTKEIELDLDKKVFISKIE